MDIVDKLDISSTLTEDQNELSEFPLEPGLGNGYSRNCRSLDRVKKNQKREFLKEETVASQTIEDAAC